MKAACKKRYLWLLSGLAVTLLGGALLAGCSGGGLLDRDKVEGDGFTCVVTFDTAGGKWSSGGGGGSSSGKDEGEQDTATRMEERYFYVRPGSLISESAIEFAETTREGYTFNTYWTGEKDSNGNVTYDKRWDFKNDRVSQNVTLYARWMENYSLIAHYGENFSKEKRFTVPQDNEGVAQPISMLSFTSENITVISMYENADKTGPITISSQTPYTAPCTPQNKVAHIYVDSLDGSWTLVREKKDFNIYANSWLYLMSDLDFENEELTFPDEFMGRVEGNNHTVSNFKVSQKPIDRNDSYFGLFKVIKGLSEGEHAEIKNITFANVTYTAVLDNPVIREYSAGVFAGRVNEDTVIENVTVTGKFDFAITNKGNTYTENHFEGTVVSNAIGYQFLNEDGEPDMSKYHVNIDGVEVNKHENELPKPDAEPQA